MEGSSEAPAHSCHVNWREAAGIQLPRVLHGEQSFTYHRTAYAGDTLSFDTRIVDVYDKKNGSLSFVKASGNGREHGAHGLAEFLEIKSLMG